MFEAGGGAGSGQIATAFLSLSVRASQPFSASPRVSVSCWASSREATMCNPRESKELADHLIDLGIKVRVLAIAVEALGREKQRPQDGIAISAMLVQLSDEIADVSEMLVPTGDAIEH
jgi:hypothetical protein